MTVKPKEESPSRPPMRDSAARAAEIRESNAHIEEIQNKYDIDPSVVPDGWTYEWKRWEILNKQDPAHMQELARSGWEAVPATRHPEMMPFGYDDTNTIIRDGMILMERPAEITAEARRVQHKAARDQRTQKEQQLQHGPDGITPDFDANPKNMKQVLKKGYESIPVPE
jgi:hypothetical protein